MKRISVLLIVMASTLAGFAQDYDLLGSYLFKHSVSMESCDIKGTPSGGESIVSQTGQRFSVVDVTKDYAILKVVNYVDYASPQFKTFNGDKSERGMVSGQKYFRIKVDVLKQAAVKYQYFGHSLTVGVLNLPFKARVFGSQKDFSTSTTFGAAIGYKFPHYDYKPFSYSLVAGIGLTSIRLDSVSVENNWEDLNKTNDFGALSTSIGAMVEYEKVQAGLFFGVDWLSSSNHTYYVWAYQGKPWLSIAFGYSIFSKEKEDSTEKGQ